MPFCREETFSPIVSRVSFSSDEDAIKWVNGTAVGLAGYFYTENIKRLWRVPEALEEGPVGCGVGLVQRLRATIQQEKRIWNGNRGKSTRVGRVFEC